MEIVKKLGRKKKEMLETADLDALKFFQENLKKNIASIGEQNLTDKEKKVIADLLILDTDDDFDRTVKALRFKHYIMKKPLTQDECTYFVDVDRHGTKPTKDRRLTKMAICKMEAAILPKLKEAIGKKMNIFSMKDLMTEDTEKFRTPAKYRNEDED